jgi:hypothetical protein
MSNSYFYKTKRYIFFSILLFAAPQIYSQTVVSFQEDINGYTGTFDTFLSTGNPDNPHGTGDFFEWDLSTLSYGLLRFENIFGSGANQIPNNAAILSASIVYFVTNVGNTADIDEATSDWDESTTFNNFPGDPLNQGDNVTTAPATPTGSYNIDVTSSISKWLSNPSLNKGWIFIPTGSNGTDASSSENGTVPNRPKLIVSYNLSDAPNQPVLGSPANGETVTDFPDLQITVTDPNGDNLNVTFYGREIVTGSPFTLIGLPDTQYYSELYPNIFLSQTQWIVANKDASNIAFVSHYGDCVQNGDQFESEWQNADAAFDVLETVIPPDGIPFGVAVGNHDQSPGGNPDGTTIFYNQYFGEARFTGRTYYGGHYGSNNDNHYEYFSASGLDFIIIHIEYDKSPDQVILDWADNLLTTHANRRAIVVTHYLLGHPNLNTFSVQGQAIYDALKDHSNLFLLLGGHVGGEGQRTDTHNGNTVHSLLADFSWRPLGGNGWLRIHEFVPASNVINVKTYSPYIDQYETNGDSQFSLNYNMTESPEAPFTQIAKYNGVTSGNTVSHTWLGINGGSTYQWYVDLDDGSSTTTGPVWSFSTDSGLPVELSSFTAQAMGTDILLNWRTETEVNNYGFDILRQAQDDKWETIGFVDGYGNTNSPKQYSFVDKTPTGGTQFSYRLKQIDNDGQYEYSEVVEVTLAPNDFALYQNYPNPFNLTTTIDYSILEEALVTIKVYNTIGEEIAVLVNKNKEVGSHSVDFNATSLTSGVYFYILRAGSFVETKKMVLMK